MKRPFILLAALFASFVVTAAGLLTYSEFQGRQQVAGISPAALGGPDAEAPGAERTDAENAVGLRRQSSATNPDVAAVDAAGSSAQDAQQPAGTGAPAAGGVADPAASGAGGRAEEIATSPAPGAGGQVQSNAGTGAGAAAGPDGAPAPGSATAGRESEPSAGGTADAATPGAGALAEGPGAAGGPGAIGEAAPIAGGEPGAAPGQDSAGAPGGAGSAAGENEELVAGAVPSGDPAADAVPPGTPAADGSELLPDPAGAGGLAQGADGTDAPLVAPVGSGTFTPRPGQVAGATLPPGAPADNQQMASADNAGAGASPAVPGSEANAGQVGEAPVLTPGIVETPEALAERSATIAPGAGADAAAGSQTSGTGPTGEVAAPEGPGIGQLAGTRPELPGNPGATGPEGSAAGVAGQGNLGAQGGATAGGLPDEPSGAERDAGASPDADQAGATMDGALGADPQAKARPDTGGAAADADQGGVNTDPASPPGSADRNGAAHGTAGQDGMPPNGQAAQPGGGQPAVAAGEETGGDALAGLEAEGRPAGTENLDPATAGPDGGGAESAAAPGAAGQETTAAPPAPGGLTGFEYPAQPPRIAALDPAVQGSNAPGRNPSEQAGAAAAGSPGSAPGQPGSDVAAGASPTPGGPGAGGASPRADDVVRPDGEAAAPADGGAGGIVAERSAAAIGPGQRDGGEEPAAAAEPDIVLESLQIELPDTADEEVGAAVVALGSNAGGGAPAENSPPPRDTEPGFPPPVVSLEPLRSGEATVREGRDAPADAGSANGGAAGEASAAAPQFGNAAPGLGLVLEPVDAVQLAPDQPVGDQEDAAAVAQATVNGAGGNEADVGLAGSVPGVPSALALEAVASDAGALDDASEGAHAPAEIGISNAVGGAPDAASGPQTPPIRQDLAVRAAEVERERLYVAGEAEPGTRVRVYADEQFVGEAETGTEGNWLLEANKDVPVGEVVIRAEAVEGEGNETVAQAEIPFLRYADGIMLEPVAVATEQEEGAASLETEFPSVSYVIIRRGDNLWRISKRNYGRGLRYQAIFTANKEKIRDPDLIYPGQIFVVPTRDRKWEQEPVAKAAN